ncbi:MAG: glycosyltransferase family 2 protein [Sporomusaceae bacterium]|nr:glycosyltransferase family 2 protein [Sporomusaceae bacterium]
MSKSITLQISIITVCYNAASTIEQTILSVINQTYESLEYIIIDGASTDGTPDIIKKFQDKITYWVSEPDTGIYQAMNKGVAASIGDYVYFLGADDSLFNKNTIATVSRYLKEAKPEVLCGAIYVVDDVFHTRMQKRTGRRLSQEEVYTGQIAPHQGMFIRTNLMKKYRYNEKYKIAGDYDLFLRLNKDGCHIKYIDDVIAFYSNGGVGASRNMPRVHECSESIGSHLPGEYVGKYQRTEGTGERLRIQFDRVVRKILNVMGLIRYYRLYYGWQPHTCDNQQCRWCNNEEREAL